NAPGVFAEYTCVRSSNLVQLPGVDIATAPLLDPLGNAVHAVSRAQIPDSDVFIVGAGPIGCMIAALCKHAGARSVVVADVSEFRLGIASAMGATDVMRVEGPVEFSQYFARDDAPSVLFEA